MTLPWNKKQPTKSPFGLPRAMRRRLEAMERNAGPEEEVLNKEQLVQQIADWENRFSQAVKSEGLTDRVVEAGKMISKWKTELEAYNVFK